MHPLRIDTLATRLGSIVDQCTEPFSDSKVIQRPSLSGSHGLHGQGEAELDALVDYLYYDNKWKEKYSKNFIQEILYKGIRITLKEPDNSGLRSYFEQVVESYEQFATQFTVHLPLIGIQPTNHSFLIGDFKIAKFDLVAARAHLCKVSQNPDFELFEQRINPFIDKMCATIVIRAEPQRANEIALEKISFILDLLRYSAAVITPKFFKTRIGLLGDFHSELRTSVSICNDDILFNTEFTGPRRYFEIDETALTKMKELKIFELATGQINHKFTSDILSSIHWYSNSIEQSNMPTKLLNLTTSLESLFTTEDGRISQTIAEGVAFLFGTDFEHRVEIKKLMLELYSVRSGVSHGGLRDVKEKDVNQLSHICESLLEVVIRYREKFQTKRDFNNWVNSLRLGKKNDVFNLTLREKRETETEG